MPIRMASIRGLKLAMIGNPAALMAKAAAATVAARAIPGRRAVGAGFGLMGEALTAGRTIPV
jgi:hypothetical protein